MVLQSKSPLFISFEGIDGCGKSTQVSQLVGWLQAAGIPVLQTREPGGTPVGREIRSLLLEGAPDKFDGLEELLLFSADRHLHLRTVIRPALAAGQWVVTDRFADTTSVFQRQRGMPEVTIATLHQLAVGELWPHLTILLDLAASDGLRRSLVKAGGASVPETRFEEMGLAFQVQARQDFLALAHQHPQRFRVVDASGDMAAVHARVQQVVTDFAAQQEAAA